MDPSPPRYQQCIRRLSVYCHRLQPVVEGQQKRLSARFSGLLDHSASARKCVNATVEKARRGGETEAGLKTHSYGPQTTG